MNNGLLILDIRGLLLRAYNTPNNPETVPDSAGNEILSWRCGLATFITRDFLPLLDTYSPRRIIAVWDSGNDYRLAAFPQYKAKRIEQSKEKDPVAKEQTKELCANAQKLLVSMGVKSVLVRGEEADDVIALLCEKLTDRNKVVWTVDSDLLQLVSDHTTVRLGSTFFRPGDTFDLSYNSQGNKKTVSVPIELHRVVKSLVGDTSDEYPGISGVGPVTIKRLIENYDVDGVLQLQDAIDSNDWKPVESAFNATQDKDLQKLLEHWSQWRSSYHLAKLHPEICYGGQGKGKVIRPKWKLSIPNLAHVKEVLSEIGIEHLEPEIAHLFPTELLVTAENYEVLSDELAKAAKCGMVAYDFESYDTLKNEAYNRASKGKKGDFVDVLSQSITGVSFNYGDNFQHTVYVSINHMDTPNLGKDWALYVLKFLDEIPTLVAHNAAFERTVAVRDLDYEVKAPYDTQIMASYTEESLDSGLKDLSKKIFGYDQRTYEDVTQGCSMNELTAQHVLHYGCDDSLVTSFLFDIFQLVMQLEGTWDFYQKYEVEHVHDESDTFIYGTRIDLDLLEKMHKEDENIIEQRTSDIRSELEVHAMNKPQEEQTSHALALLEMDWELKKHDFEDPSSPEAVEARKQLWNKNWFRAVYTPYSVQEELPGFKPTPKNLNTVLDVLGISERIEKATARAMANWVESVEDRYPQHKKFFSLLGPAVSEFPASKRSNEAYKKFEAFCVGKLAQAGGMKNVASGDELNFGSPPQMQALLYGILGLPLRRRSKVTRGSRRDQLGISGAPSTGLKPIAAALVYDIPEEDWRHPVLLGYRDICKAQQNISLYYDPYPLWVSPKDGLIHPQIKNCGTVTRRPSGTSPNVLQVSKQGEAKIRKVYTPFSEDYAYVCLDFAGQELRLTASESKDPVMLDAYLGEQKKDIHALTGSSLAPILLPRMDSRFGDLAGRAMTYEQFIAGRNSEEDGSFYKSVRDSAKPVNFLIIYVGGPGALAEGLIIPIELAREMMSATFRLYKRLQPWQGEVIEEARRYGYVTTAYGNRRHLSSDLYSSDDFLRTRQERQAVNMKAQGCAADILKIVKTEYRRRRIMQRYKVRSSKPIYDEIAACAPVAAIPEYIAEMREIMELTPPDHPVPMKIDGKIGFKSWGDAIELDNVEPETITTFLAEQLEETK